MKKFKHLALLLLATVVVFGCSKYDDSELKKDVSDLQERVAKLEEWCKTANTQIGSLQSLVTALEAKDYVTGVTPVMEGTTEVGYTITFTKSKPVTIKHGKDGANGDTPIIGVKKDTDGIYYWTIQTGTAEATWMLDAEGNKIRTTGGDGAAGQKPSISVAKDGDRYYWKVDGEWLKGTNGEKIPATGDKGDKGDKGDTGAAGSNGSSGPSGDSFFSKVTPDAINGYVVFKLKNGTEFTLPMLSTTVSFDAYTPMQIATTDTPEGVIITLPTSLKKGDFAAIQADITNVVGTNSAITRATPTEKWGISLTAPTFKLDGDSTLKDQPVLTVTVPASAETGETALLTVTVVDTKGNKSTSTRVLFYSDEVMVTGVTLAPTTLTVKVGKTSTPLTATIVPANATNQNVTWTSSDPTVASVTDGAVKGEKAGTATITVTTVDGGKTATCAVTVENIALTNIALTDATISIGDKKTLAPTFTPTDATIKTLTWSTSNAAIATVNATTGEVEGKTAGEVTITATSTEYPSIKGTCKVTVTAQPSITWAKGNLVAKADGSGCEVGAATDGGLYFQFGSLVGWAGGANGDGKGTPANGLALAAKVTPAGYTATPWSNSWTGDPAETDASTGKGDPCKHYLGGTWRLPTKDEYVELFKDNGYPSTGPWKWENSSATNSTIDLTFPASGYRYGSVGSLSYVGTYGYFWSSSPSDDDNGYSLYFYSSNVYPSTNNLRAYGVPVRCVQASN